MKAYQKKLLIYGIPAVLCCIAAALVAGLAFQVGILYSLFWGMFFGGAGATLARLVYHLYLKDYAPEMWQITIYMLLACGGWLGGILSTSWGWTTLWLAVMCIGILMALGTRFCKAVAEARTKNSLENTLRYQFVDDRLGGTPNLDKPLTLIVDGQALTVAEALKAGKTDAARKGRDYIRKITEGK